MKLFFLKPKKYNPIVFIVAKISDPEMMEKIEALSHEIFHILMDEKVADETNILIFSIIKDYDKATINMILPSTESNTILVERCHENAHFVNTLIVDTLINVNTELFLEILDSKILLYSDKVKHSHNLTELAYYFKISD
jgi:hypothetical protein